MLYPRSFGDNPLYPQESDFAVVHNNNETGLGVISLREFKSGELLAVVTGERVSDIRQHTLQIDEDNHLLDMYFTGYLLHSCSPNVSLDMQKMTLTAIKDIEANTYLYMDYAETEDVLYKQFPCACGSDNCRGWITGRKEMPLAIVQGQNESAYRLVAEPVSEGADFN